MTFIKYWGLIVFSIGLCHGKETHKVHCSPELMRVEIKLPATYNMQQPQVYLEGMKGYPNPVCHPQFSDSLAVFKLSLIDIYECGVTRVTNKITGKKVFYHTIIIEGDSEYEKEIVSVKCITAPPLNKTRHAIGKRDTFPIDFKEQEDLEITTLLTEKAPEPVLNVGVRQNGELVSGDLNVSPGTPLMMEIFLDNTSAPIYGIGVTHMQVTDTKTQEETIIFNGCSVDPFLFENFNTVDGDFLAAKFRAFKFPESTFVQFRGTVNVCLDKCKGITCSNGQMGYGRRRRDVNTSGDPNRVYEISMTTFIKVNYDDKTDIETANELEKKIKQLKIANQKLARNSREFQGKDGNSNAEDNVKPIVLDNSAESASVQETPLFKTISLDIEEKTAATSNSIITSNSFLLNLLLISISVMKLFL